MSADYDENEAVRLFIEGDEDAFSYIFNEYAPGIYKVAVRYLQSSEMAEDLVQEIFSTLWTKRDEFSGVLSFRAYLFTMSKNMAIKYLKKIAREALVNQEFADRQSTDDPGTEQYEELLRKTIDELPPQQKLVFTLTKMQGLSHEEAAKQLNISPSTVNNHLVAALRFIRQRIPRFASSVMIAMALHQWI